MRTKLGVGLTMIVAVVIAACGGGGGGISITDAYVTTSSSSALAALYFTIENTGRADTLLSVSTDGAGTASFHESVVSGASVSMQPRDHVEIPANGQFRFRPGEYHVMLKAAGPDLEPGQTIEVTATFAHAGERTFSAVVRGTGVDERGDEF